MTNFDPDLPGLLASKPPMGINTGDVNTWESPHRYSAHSNGDGYGGVAPSSPINVYGNITPRTTAYYANLLATQAARSIDRTILRLLTDGGDS